MFPFGGDWTPWQTREINLSSSIMREIDIREVEVRENTGFGWLL